MATRATMTKNRQTRITFDSYLPHVVQPLYVMMKSAADMAKGACPDKVNVVLLHDSWQLEAYQYNYGQAPLTAVGSGWITPTTAAQHSTYDTQRQSGLLGVTYSGVDATSVPMTQKRIPAGTSFAQALTADQAAFASPDTGDDPVDMDRIAITAATHDPTKGLFFVLRIPLGSMQALGPITAVYFNGPAGSDCHDDGNGQYSLKIFDDGRAVLYELAQPIGGGDYEWKKRKSFTLFQALASGAVLLYLTIATNLRQKADGSYVGNKIVISPMSIHRPGFLPVEGLIGLAKEAIEQSANLGTFSYVVPQKRTNPVSLAPSRLDMRRDVRAQWALANLVYKEEGHLVDDPFVLPFFPDTSKDFSIEYYGSVPTGCTLVVRLFDASDDSEITPTSTFEDDLGGIYTFTPVNRHNRYYVRFDWTGDGTNTAKLTSYRVFREPVVETPPATPTVVPERTAGITLAISDVTNINIKGNNGDPRQDSASFTVEDYLNSYPWLRTRGNIPVLIETAYDATPNYTTLFRGYTRAIRSIRKGRDPQRSYPDKEYYAHAVECVGEWKRLSQLKVPRRYFFWDKTVDAPMKITDIVKILLRSLGYPDTMIDIRDLPIRLFSNDEEEYIVEPGSIVAEFIVGLIADYLGGYLIWDEAAGDYGMWRLVLPKVAPFNNLVIFEEEQTTDLRLPHITEGYGTTPGDGDYSSQTVLHTFMRAGTVHEWTEELEGNIVTVHGLAGEGSSSKSGSPNTLQLTSVAVNVNSFNFLNIPFGDPGYPDQSHPDYVGFAIPLDVYDPTLTTQAACDWVCRRVYDYAAHNRNYKSFEAPLLLVTDAYDTNQMRPRKLRFGDAVQVRQFDDTLKQYLVADCTPMYVRDGFQWAHYDLVTASNIETYGIP